MPSLDHPSLNLPVTDEQRDRTIDFLNQAYADGRLERLDLEERIERALTATTRRELNACLDGLARVPLGTGSSLPASRPASAMSAASPGVGPVSPGPVSRGAAAVAHFSAFGTMMIGPGVVYAMSTEGSHARREAAKAFNFQVVSLVALVLVHTLLPTSIGNVTSAVLATIWFMLTLIGGVKAARGENWRNPVTTIAPLRILDEGPRRPVRRPVAPLGARR